MTKLSEIEVLKAVDDALTHLTPEEKQRVFNYVASKHALVQTNNNNNSSGQNAGGQNGGANAGNGSQNTGDIKQFLATKKPQGFYEQIACLGYYLEKIQGLESFDTKDITEANTTARITKIPHSSVYVKNCFAQYGYLVQVGGGKKALSARGEALVEALPDREAVKIALENNPMKKKSATKKKKAVKKKATA